MKKMISLLLALAMALSLVACGAGNDAQNDGAAGTDAAPANALEQIKADGVLTVALSPDFPPWSLWTPLRPDRISTLALM